MLSCFGGELPRDSRRGYWIQLENLTGNFNSGDTVIGEVILITDHPKVLKSISIKFYGRARVHWSRAIGRYTRHYKSDEVYFSEGRILFGNDSGTTTLPEGTHRYPFAYILREGIPSSFSHEFGNIEYFMEVEMKRPWNKLNPKGRLNFKVVGPLNLNASTGLSSPIKLSKSKYISDFLCHVGQVGFILQLEKTCYVPGESIQFRAEIENRSTMKLPKPIVKLLQITTFHAELRQKQELKIIDYVEGERLPSGAKKVWTGSVEIPIHAQTSFVGCGIIRCHYLLRFEQRLPLLWRTARREVALTVGAVQLQNHNASDNLTYPNTSNSSIVLRNDNQNDNNFGTTWLPSETCQFRPSGVRGLNEGYESVEFDILPPTYEEAMRLDSYPRIFC